MRAFKWPWEKRAEHLEAERKEAEERLAEVERDWEPIRGYAHAVHKEVLLNDWTATAKRMFTGDTHVS